MKKALSLSDKLNQENLLRFYVPEGFETIDPKKYDYKNEAQKNESIEKQKGNSSTSVYSKNGNKTTTEPLSNRTSNKQMIILKNF